VARPAAVPATSEAVLRSGARFAGILVSVVSLAYLRNVSLLKGVIYSKRNRPFVPFHLPFTVLYT